MIKETRGWIRGLQRNKMLQTWRRFKSDVVETFGDSPFEDKVEELLRLQQTTLVSEYMARFELLMSGETHESEEGSLARTKVYESNTYKLQIQRWREFFLLENRNNHLDTLVHRRPPVPCDTSIDDRRMRIRRSSPTQPVVSWSMH